MVEEIEDYQRKWHNHVERMPLDVHQGKHIFIILLEDRALDTQEEDGHNSSFSFRMGHDSILELSEEEDIIQVCILNLLSNCFCYQGLSCQIWVDVWCFHHKSTAVRR
jgi:hypothetical protein